MLALAACDSGSAAKDAKSTPGKADAKAPVEVDADKEAELIANAPPEGEIKEDGKSPTPAAGGTATDQTVLDHEVKLLDGKATKLADFKGKALLVVNTASECGFTPQYEDLQTVYAKYRDRGFEVLAFPSNDFGEQEPGSSDDIRKFVDDNYKVEFPVFEKVTVKGDAKVDLYDTLTKQGDASIDGEIKWNFTKFLIDPTGKVVKRFEPKVKPTDPEVIAAIEAVLPKGT